MDKKTVLCPACSSPVAASFINAHLDLGCKGSVKTSDEAAVSKVVPPASSSGSSVPRNLKKRPADYTDQSNGHLNPTVAKKFKSTEAIDSVRPFADRMRPALLEDVIGQSHLLGPGQLFRNLIDNDTLGSILLHGPPGTGRSFMQPR